MLVFRAGYVLVIMDCGARRAGTSGTRCAFIMRILDRPRVKRIVLWATESIGRWFQTGGEGWGVFQLRGRKSDQRPIVTG